jgi:hypothetical protein
MIDIIAFVVVAAVAFYFYREYKAKHAGTNPVAAPVVPSVPVATTPTTPPAA